MSEIHSINPNASLFNFYFELRFLQDEQQKQLKIFDIQEYDKILELAKLYSLNIQTENGCIILNKTRWVIKQMCWNWIWCFWCFFFFFVATQCKLLKYPRSKIILQNTSSVITNDDVLVVTLNEFSIDLFHFVHSAGWRLWNKIEW